MEGRRLHSTALCFTQPGTNRCFALRDRRSGLMKGRVDPITNQYVPNMQRLLQLLMKKQAGWFIVMGGGGEGVGWGRGTDAAQLSPG